jgi:hypothetical protein
MGTFAANAAAVANVASTAISPLCRAIPPTGNTTPIADNLSERRRRISLAAASILSFRSIVKPPTTKPQQDRSEWHMKKIEDAILALAAGNDKHNVPKRARN